MTALLESAALPITDMTESGATELAESAENDMPPRVVELIAGVLRSAAPDDAAGEANAELLSMIVEIPTIIEKDELEAVATLKLGASADELDVGNIADTTPPNDRPAEIELGRISLLSAAGEMVVELVGSTTGKEIPPADDTGADALFAAIAEDEMIAGKLDVVGIVLDGTVGCTTLAGRPALDAEATADADSGEVDDMTNAILGELGD